MKIQTPERRGTVAVANRRQLTWYEWGPVTGIPILFRTGAGMSGSLGFGFEELTDLDIRLISVDRPGLGRSSLHGAKTFRTWAEDISDLCKQLDLAKPGAVGFSQGAPFALTLLAADLATAAAIVAGQDELAHPSVVPQLTTGVRQMVEELERDPEGFAEHFLHVASADGLWDLVSGMSSERDLELYASEPFRTAYLACLKEGFSQGPQGYVLDLVNALMPWPFELEALASPVRLWYGAQDISPVHAPDFGETLARRLPNVKLRIYPDEGGSLLWTRARDVLVDLRSVLR